MSERIKIIKKAEVWIPLVLIIIGNIVALSLWAGSIKSDIRHNNDLTQALIDRLDKDETAIHELRNGENTLASQVYTLNGMHDIR